MNLKIDHMVVKSLLRRFNIEEETCKISRPHNNHITVNSRKIFYVSILTSSYIIVKKVVLNPFSWYISV